MKVVLDLDKLLAEGGINAEEHARLAALAAKDTGKLAFNILVGFGVVATAGGMMALLKSPAAAAGIGLGLAAAGAWLSKNFRREWGLLGKLLLLVGTIATVDGLSGLPLLQSPTAVMGIGLGLAASGAWLSKRNLGREWGSLGKLLLLVGTVAALGGFVGMTKSPTLGFVLATIACAAGAWLANSGLLASLGVLSLAGTMGAAVSYGHASYAVQIRQPAATIGMFGAVAFGLYWLSKRADPDKQRLALIAARTAVLLTNLGFWIGSLWGDPLRLMQDRAAAPHHAVVPDWAFALGWAACLIGAGVWAARNNLRWVVNNAATFGAIHFFTQFFERLGASPATMMCAGLATLGIAFGIVRYNRVG